MWHGVRGGAMTTSTLPPGLITLGDKPNWVNWNLEPRAGDPKPTKVPYTPSLAGPQVKAKAGEPATWGTSATAFQAAKAGRFTGVGFEFHAGEGLLLLDLDKVIDAAGKIAPVARAIMALANSYAEPSPSNTGVRIIAQGELPRPLIPDDRQGKKKGGFELYGGAHFGTLTCRPFRGYDELRTIDADTMVRLFALMWPEDLAPKSAPAVPLPPLAPAVADDRALLEQAFSARNGSDFHTRHQGGYILPDRSGDDFAYLMTLAFWTQNDAGRMRRIALASGRVREKWLARRGASDLLDYSIAKACAEQHTVYDPGQRNGARFVVPETGEVVTDFAPLAAEFTRTLEERDQQVARAERLLTYCRQEHERKDLRLADLETQVAALEAAISYPDSTMGGTAFDVAQEAFAARQRGESLVEEGKERFRVCYKTAAKWRSSTTVGNATKKFHEHKAVAASFRKVKIETENFAGEVDAAYVEIPPDCETPAKFVLHLLKNPVEKKHGGNRRIEVPTSEQYPDAPVKRVTRREDVWRSLADDQVLRIDQRPEVVAYFSAQGDELNADEAAAYQEALGAVAPKRVPTYRPPVQRPLSEADRELVRRPTTDDAPLPPPTPFNGPRCRASGCGRSPGASGYCTHHDSILAMAAGAD